jgi:hypothetical protein
VLVEGGDGKSSRPVAISGSRGVGRHHGGQAKLQEPSTGSGRGRRKLSSGRRSVAHSTEGIHHGGSR